MTTGLAIAGVLCLAVAAGARTSETVSDFQPTQLLPLFAAIGFVLARRRSA